MWESECVYASVCVYLCMCEYGYICVGVCCAHANRNRFTYL